MREFLGRSAMSFLEMEPFKTWPFERTVDDDLEEHVIEYVCQTLPMNLGKLQIKLMNLGIGPLDLHIFIPQAENRFLTAFLANLQQCSDCQFAHLLRFILRHHC